MILSSPGLNAHGFVGNFADEGFGISAVHGGFEEEDVVHRVVARGRGPVGFGVGLWVCRSHAVGAADGCFG